MPPDEPKAHEAGATLPYSSMDDTEAIPRTSSQVRRRGAAADTVKTVNFAGRLGGNQQFTVPDPSESTTADAIRNARWSTLLDPTEFKSVTLWKSAIIEGIATCLQTYLGSMLIIGLLPTADATSLGPVTPVAFAGVIQIFLIALFVYAAGPVTGGHLNPLITLGTFFAGLSSLPRTVLYVSFQCVGAIIGALIFRESIGASPQALRVIPGCYADPAIVTPGQAFAVEFMFSFLTLFLAFGLGLDPRNAGAFGPGLAPILIGISSAINVFSGAIARPGYLGASSNPARCLALATVSHNFVYHYIHWTGDIAAAMVNGLMYFVIPPYQS